MAKQKAAERGEGSFFRRENATEGGGINGALATMSIGFVQEFTYGGRFRDKPSCALRVEYEIDGFDKPWEDHFPIGPSDNFRVSKDGFSVEPAEGVTLNKKSAGYFFLDNLQDALDKQGLDVDDYLPEEGDGGVSVKPLDGLQVRLTSKPFENVSGDKKDKAVIASLVLEGETKGSGKSNGKSSGKSSSRSSSDEINDKTVEAIKALLEDQSRIKKQDLPNEIYDANRKDADAKAMMQLAFKEAWLAEQAEEGHFNFDKKKGVITPAEE